VKYEYPLRLTLRIVTLILGVAIVAVVLTSAFWYVWQTARGNTPSINYEITMEKLEQTALSVYLRYQGDIVTEPADPSDTEPREFVVNEGEPLLFVAWRLEEQGLVEDGDLFRRVVQYHGADRDILAGVSYLAPSMTMEEVMFEMLHHSLPLAVWVTIPEGWRAEQIAAELARESIVSEQEFMAAVNRGRSDYDFLLDRPAGSSPSLEGFLFPDTYRMERDASADEVLTQMLDNWERRVMGNQGLVEAIEEREDMTLYELVTLASVVEREAVVAEERDTIAAVFQNRLRQDMYLQADPTVSYAKGYVERWVYDEEGRPVEDGTWWSPMLMEEATSVISPYNTYLNPGLPPTPICNPGLAAIRAAIKQQRSDYLFFVAKGDGSHWFARTYEEHLRYNAMREE
jgi:UPF0755 protein